MTCLTDYCVQRRQAGLPGGPGEIVHRTDSFPGRRISGNVRCLVIVLAENYNLATTANHKGTKAQKTLKILVMGLQLWDSCGLPGAAPGSCKTIVAARHRVRALAGRWAGQAAMLLGRARREAIVSESRWP